MSRPRQTVHKYSSLYDGSRRGDAGCPDDLWVRRLAARIILRAAEDWINLLHARAKLENGEPAGRVENYKYHRCGGSSHAEILAFLSGEYGGMLCGGLDIDPDAIIDRLRSWEREFERSGAIPKCTFYAKEDD